MSFLLGPIYFPTLTERLSFWMKKNSKQYYCKKIHLKNIKGGLQTKWLYGQTEVHLGTGVI